MDALCSQLMSVMRSRQPLSGTSCSTCCLLLTHQTCGAVLSVSVGERLCWVPGKTGLAPCRVSEEISQLSADCCQQKGSSTESAADAVSSAGHSHDQEFYLVWEDQISLIQQSRCISDYSAGV